MSRKFGSRSLKVAVTFICLVFGAGGNLPATGTEYRAFGVMECRKFDEFVDLNCEDLSARLDNYAVNLQESPDAQAIISYYEGTDSKGRNPRRGEASTRAARMKDYLVTNRGLSAQRILLNNRGYGDQFTVQLYICPREAARVMPSSIGDPKDIKFRKGKISKREYKWHCLE